MTTPARRHPASRAVTNESRAVTDELLAELRSGRWQPRAWGRFLGRAAVRSWAAARQRPRAVVEVTVLHAGLAAVRRWSTSGAAGDGGRGHRSGASWVAISWALSITHLGMLESGRSLGVANVLTLVRANLPPIAAAGRPAGPIRSPDRPKGAGANPAGAQQGMVHAAAVQHAGARQAGVRQAGVRQAGVRQAGVLAAAALVSDLVDGQLARRRGAVTPFGRYADSIADAAFWTWFALRHEPDRRMRLLALGAWTFPVAMVTVISMARGGMIDAPSPAVARPAVVMQIVLTARAIGRSRRFAPSCSSSP